MQTTLQQQCDRLAENKDAITRAFRWANSTMNLASAYIATAQQQAVDTSALKASEGILKDGSSAFSPFRGTLKVPVLTKMTLSGHPERYLEDTMRCYDLLKAQKKWTGNDYLAMAALALSDRLDGEDAPSLVDRTVKTYQLMKSDHPWLTTGEDLVFAAILGASGADIKELMQEASSIYGTLKGRFFDSNAVLALSHVLALGEAPTDVKCERIIGLFEGLKEAKRPYGTTNQLATLGPLVFLDIPVETLVDEIIEADNYLKTKKGFGDFGLGSTIRRMYAAQMVLHHHVAAETGADAVVLGSMLAVVIAVSFNVSVMVAATVNTTMLHHN